MNRGGMNMTLNWFFFCFFSAPQQNVTTKCITNGGYGWRVDVKSNGHSKLQLMKWTTYGFFFPFFPNALQKWEMPRPVFRFTENPLNIRRSRQIVWRYNLFKMLDLYFILIFVLYISCLAFSQTSKVAHWIIVIVSSNSIRIGVKPAAMAPSTQLMVSSNSARELNHADKRDDTLDVSTNEKKS